MDPKVHVFLVCYNEEAILASTVRHYRRCFRDCKITIFDNMSDDSSRAIATAAGCSIVPWDSPHQGQLDEDTLTQVKNHLWKSHVEEGTWVVMADMDEWLCCSLAQLAEEEEYGTTILSTQGWQMVGESLREDLTDLNLDEVCKGWPDKDYSKRLCFRWPDVDPRFCYGCHGGVPAGRLVESHRLYPIKHMASLGGEYLAAKNARRYARNKRNREILQCSNHYIAVWDKVLKMHAEQVAKAVRLQPNGLMEIRDEAGELVDIARVETHEQQLAVRHIRPGDTVLELGARYGSTSCLINAILDEKGRQVSVEPDERVWAALEDNRDRLGCGFHIVKGVVSRRKWALTDLDDCNGYGTRAVEQEDSDIPSFDLKAVQETHGLTFDVLFADCEGFMEAFMAEHPEFFDDLRLVIFEADGRCNYTAVREGLASRGMRELQTGFHNVWEKREWR